MNFNGIEQKGLKQSKVDLSISNHYRKVGLLKTVQKECVSSLGKKLLFSKEKKKHCHISEGDCLLVLFPSLEETILGSYQGNRYGFRTQTERAMAPHSSTLAQINPMDGGAWQAAVHGIAKSWTRLSDFTFTFHFHALEKEMATHSSVLAWRIPGTGKPGGLPSMGSHRVGHD